MPTRRFFNRPEANSRVDPRVTDTDRLWHRALQVRTGAYGAYGCLWVGALVPRCADLANWSTLLANYYDVPHRNQTAERATTYVAVYHRSPGTDWPLDSGDDPSFASSNSLAHRGGVLTWGVCRTDVRNKLNPGDLVIFFATDRLADRRQKRVRYNFVGFATVARKVSQVEIWQDRTLSIYRRYSNLLIKPNGNRFDHFEPALPPRRWHDDWYWRIAAINGHRKSEFDDVYGASGLSLRNQLVPVARNYVLFEPEGAGTMILHTPPVIATASGAGRPEVWKQTPFARGLRAWLKEFTARSLRTTNAQRAHRHITIHDANGNEWREHIRALCKTSRLRPRKRVKSSPIRSRRPTDLGGVC